MHCVAKQVSGIMSSLDAQIRRQVEARLREGANRGSMFCTSLQSSGPACMTTLVGRFTRKTTSASRPRLNVRNGSQQRTGRQATPQSRESRAIPTSQAPQPSQAPQLSQASQPPQASQPQTHGELAHMLGRQRGASAARRSRQPAGMGSQLSSSIDGGLDASMSRRRGLGR